MKSTTLIVLVVAAGAVGGLAWYVSTQGRAVVKEEATSGMMFPDLGSRVNDVSTLIVKKGDKESTFRRTATGWEVSDRGGFPAKIEKIKEVMIGISQFRKLEQKTSKPENYGKIGVEDPVKGAEPAAPPSPTEPPAPASNATLVTMKNEKGETVASVILGNVKWEGKGSTYIRKAGDAQSWLVEGRVEMPYDFAGWVDNSVVSVARERVKEAEIIHADGQRLKITKEKKEDQNFTVVNVPQGEELSGPSAPEAVAGSISGVTLEDVAPADQIDFAGAKGGAAGTPVSRVEFATFDGMKLTILMADKDGKSWIQVTAAVDETLLPPPAPDAKPEDRAKQVETLQKEVNDLNAKTAKWAFAIPAYKASALKTHMQDLLKSKVPAQPASLNEGNQAPAFPLPGAGAPSAPPPATPASPAPAPTGATGPATPPAAPSGSTGPTTPTGEPATTGTPAPTGTPAATGSTGPTAPTGG